MAKANAGGGVLSNKNVSPKVRTGKGTEKIAEKGVSQIGQQFGNAAALVEIPAGRGMNPCKYGNEVALNSGQKPGQGRDIHPHGGQGQHGPSAGGRPEPTSELLPGFGGKKGS